MDDNEEFERQLQLEAEEAKKETKIEKSQRRTYTDESGTVYEWNDEKQAFFPLIDEDFIARYQSQYGSNEVEEEAKSGNPIPKTDQKVIEESEGDGEPGAKKQKKEESKPTWFEVDDEHNTNVYVSGLPLDITEEEFVELMQKCGMVLRDLESNKFKIKLYRDSHGNLKGDALCSYIKPESVVLALQILDEYDFKGNKIKVERAKFTMKGEYDPSKKPRRKKQDKQKMKKKIDKLFSWKLDKLPGERPKFQKVVVIFNMFDIKEFAKDPRLILDYRNDLMEECSEKCGEVKKVEILDNNPKGVALVHFTEFESADKCVELMDGRFFAGRQLTAHLWDGKTRYKIDETEEEIEKRMTDWEKYLDDPDHDETVKKPQSTS